MGKAGFVEAGLEIYVQRKQWQKVFETARGQGPAISGRYAVVYARELLEDGKVAHALQALAEHGVDSDSRNAELFRDLVKSAMSLTAQEESEFGADALRNCREMMFQVLAQTINS